jgi:ligand-binding sensor domain-containing protein
VNTVREDPKAKNLLYVGTDMGVFVSLDSGQTWMAMGGGLPHVPVHDLQSIRAKATSCSRPTAAACT